MGTMPRAEDYRSLYDLGVKLVINMRFWIRPADNFFELPMDFLWLRTIDSPLFPIPVRKLLHGAKTALETIRAGGKVYTHCAHGRHRSAAMGAAVLIAQGHSPEAAMALIKTNRPEADPGAFYIRSRIYRFARQWQAA